MIGSASYLSPEQAAGAADERSDLYALGCVLVTKLMGSPPFTAEHPIAVLHQHISELPPRVSERRPGVSPALDVLVGQLLSKRAEDRPSSAEEVGETTGPHPDYLGADRYRRDSTR